MKAFDRLYLDTNVFILLAEGAHSPELNLLQDLVRVVGRKTTGKPFLYTSEFTLAELLVRPLKSDDGGDLVTIYEDWFAPNTAWMEIGQVDRKVLVDAAWIRAHYASVKMPDALHLSTALQFGCSHFLTADKKLPETVSIRPSKEDQLVGASELTTIEPTATMLGAIVDSQS